MTKMTMLSTAKAKILYDASKPLTEKGMVFVNVVTKEKIKNIQELVALSGETNIGVYNLKEETMIGTLMLGNSVYNDNLTPPKVIWTLRLCSSSNEKAGLAVKSIIERKGPMIRLKIISVIY